MDGATNPDASEPDVGVDAGFAPTNLVVSPRTLMLIEGAAPGSFAVSLDGPPETPVTITITSSTAAVTVMPTSLTFTTADFNQPKMITVAVTDDPDTNNATAILIVDHPETTDVAISVSVTDDDVQALVVSPTAININQTGTSSIGVRLAAEPNGTVMVALTNADPSALTVSPQTMMFTPANWQTAQSALLSGIEDDDVTDELVDVTVSSTGLADVSVTVTITDNDVLSLVVNPVSVTIAEGGSVANVDISLSHRPDAPVDVAITGSDNTVINVAPTLIQILPASFDRPQTVSVSAVDDDDDRDETATVDLSATGLAGRQIAVAVTDDDEQDLEISVDAVSVAEGGTETFTLWLTAEPQSAVSVMIASSDPAALTVTPTDVTFDATTWNMPMTVTVEGLHDPDGLDDNVVLTFSSLIATTRFIPATVVDDDIQALIVDPTTIQVTEGGTGTFDVSLTVMPPRSLTVNAVPLGSAVTVDSSTLTFSSGNWNVPQTVTVTGVHDQDLADGSDIIEIRSTETPTISVSVAILDDDTQSVIVVPASVAVVEGGPTATFVASLAFAPASNVTVMVTSADPGAATASPTSLTFTPTDWAVPQTVTVAPEQDDDTVDEITSINLTNAALTGASVAVGVSDEDVQALIVAPTALSLTENGVAAFTVRLAFDPIGTVAVAVLSDDPLAAEVSSANLTFTRNNYATAQTVTVSGVDDIDVANELAMITISSTVSASVALPTTVIDDDTQTIVTNTPTLTITEDDTAMLAVSLRFQPSASVMVGITSNNPAVATVSQSSLTFTPTNYATPQTITIQGVRDPNSADDVATISLDGAGALPAGVTVTVTDIDEQSLIVTPSTLMIREGEAPGTFAVRLATQPASATPVDLTISNGAAASLSTPRLVFTPSNYATPQRVEVIAIDDVDTSDENVTVTVASAGLTPSMVAVAIADEDTQAIVVTPSALQIVEGTSARFRVALAFRPAQDVTVNVMSLDPSSASVVVTALIFTTGTYALPQSVTINTSLDANSTDEQTTIQLSSTGLNTVNVPVSVVDIDAQNILITPTVLTLTEGGPTSALSIRLATAPATNVTVSITSSDPSAATFGPSQLTFTPALFDVPQIVSVTPANDPDADNESMRLTASAPGLTDRTVAITITDNDVQALVVGPLSTSVTEGQTASINVRFAFDPGGPTTVTLSSANPSAVAPSPSTLTFTSANYSMDQVVTLVGLEDEDTASGQTTIGVHSTIAPDVTVAVEVIDDDVQTIVVSPTAITVDEGGAATIAISLAFAPSANVVVNAQSSDQAVATLDRPSVSFTPSNYAIPQLVRVIGAQDADLDDDTTSITLSSAGLAPRTVATTVVDDDAQAIVLDRAALVLDEGGAPGTFSARLAFAPTQTIAVSLASSDEGAATLSTTQMTFTAANYSQAQIVSVNPVADDDVMDDASTISVQASGLTTRLLEVTVRDDDRQALIVTPVALQVGEASSAEVTVALAFRPAAAVSISIGSADPSIAVASPSVLTFTSATYDQPQTVTITGIDDDDVLDDSTTIAVTSAGLAPSSISVLVADDDAQSILVAPTTLSLVEGGTPSAFTVRLAFIPTNPVTVDVASLDVDAATVSPATLTFTAADYQSPRAVMVTPVADDDTANESVTVSLTSAGLSVRTVAVAITDDDVQSLIVTPTTVTFTEGQTAEISVRLQFDPVTQTAVTLSSSNLFAVGLAPIQLTFDSNDYQTPKVVTLDAVEDDDTENENVTVTVVSSVATSVPVNIMVADNDVQALIVAPLTLTFGEGQTDVLTVRLAAQPSGNRVVTFSVADTGAASAPASVTFDAGNWSVDRMITIMGLDDDDLLDEITSVTVSSDSLTSVTVPISIVDDDRQSIVLAPLGLSLTEGGFAGSVTVRLAFQPSQNVTVNMTSFPAGVLALSPPQLLFGPGSYAINQTVTVSPLSDVDLEDEVASVFASASGLATQTSSVTVTDDDTQALVVTPLNLTVEEGSSESFLVSLAFQPSTNLTVDLTSAAPNAAFVTPTTLTITRAMFDQPQVVMVSALHDGDNNDESTQVVVSAPGVPPIAVQVEITDDDTQRVLLDPTTLTLAEGGGTATFTARLALMPNADTTVTLVSSDTGAATLSTGTLTFTTTDFDQPQSVTITPVDDNDVADESVVVSASAAGLPTTNLAVTVEDDEDQILLLDTLTIEVAEGATATIAARLMFDPGETITIELAAANAQIATASPTQLVFQANDWMTPQIISITGVQDVDDADGATTIALTSVSAPGATINVTVRDDDVQRFVLDTTSLNVTENGISSALLSLAFRPTASIVVTTMSNDVAIAQIFPQSLTFTPANYATPQSLNVIGTDDPDTQSASTFATISAAEVPDTATVTITVTDDDIQSLVVNPTAISVLEGATASFGVNLAFTPPGDVIVTVASTNEAAATVNFTTLTFTPQNFATVQTITITGVEDADLTTDNATVQVSATGLVTVNVAVTVNDNDAQSIVVNPTSHAMSEGGQSQMTVRLAFMPQSNITVTLTSADSGAVSISDASLVFTPTDFATERTVTLTAAVDQDAADESVTIDVRATGLDTVFVTATVDDTDTQAFLLSRNTIDLNEGATDTFTVRLAFDPVSTQAVGLSSNDAAVSPSPTALFFTSSNWATPQQVTVLGTSDFNTVSETATVTVSGAIAASERVVVNVTDDDMQRVVVSPTVTSVNEGSSVSVNVSLAFIPESDVTVTMVSPDPGTLTASPPTVTFTAANYNVPQPVLLMALSDSDPVSEGLIVQAQAPGLGATLIQVSISDNDASTGFYFSPGNATTFNGSISPVGNVDNITLNVLAESYVRAFVAVPSGASCTADTVIRIFNSSGVEIGSDDDDGVGTCSEVDPAFDAFTRLTAGTYYLSIEEKGNDATIPAFTIQVHGRPVNQCGNRALEGSEQCDDGNTASGDGCSDICQFEGASETEPNDAVGIADVITGPAAVVGGSITPATDVDVWEIDVPAGSHLVAYLTVDSFLGCPDNPDGRLALIDTDETTVLATNVTGGPGGNCGRIAPDTTMAALSMAGGTYYLRVDENGANTSITQYYLHVQVVAPGCGNGIVEGTEQCDDGNMTNGDFCSSGCEGEHQFGVPSTSSFDVYRVSPSASTRTRSFPVSNPAHRPTWSQSGNRIAFSHEESFGYGFEPRVSLYDLTGGNVVASFAGAQPDWSANGQSIIALDNNQACFRTYDVNTGVQQCFFEISRNMPRWDPAAPTRWAFTTGASTLTIRNGQSLRFDVATQVNAYEWSPSGDRILYTQTSGGGCNLAVATINETSVGAATTIASGVDCASRIAWAPSGSEIAFSNPGGTYQGLFVVSLSQSLPVSLPGLTAIATSAGGFTEVRYTSNGEFVGYSVGSAGNFDLFLCPPGGGMSSQPIMNQGGTGQFSFSP